MRSPSYFDWPRQFIDSVLRLLIRYNVAHSNDSVEPPADFWNFLHITCHLESPFPTVVKTTTENYYSSERTPLDLYFIVIIIYQTF